jgi:regulator of protease activity HflC (stomatin/prohibitin superfamily)
LVGFIIFAVIAFIAVIVWRKFSKQSKLVSRTAGGAGVLFGLIAAACLVGAMAYTQDPGEAVVQRDTITGKIVGQTTTEGLYFKAPWVDTVTFNIRNQKVSFAGSAETGYNDNAGGAADGAQVTVQDKEGVSSNIDITLRYSIKADSVTDIYRQFKDEDNFKSSFITQDIRSVVRSVPTQFTTLELITKRGEIEAQILEALEDRWKSEGVIIDSISLQEIRVPDSVKEAYASAQEAQINVEKERSNLEAEEVKAQQKVANATAEAEANRLLTESLNDNVLKQRYLDTLSELGKDGNVIVVPEGFNALGSIK